MIGVSMKIEALHAGVVIALHNDKQTKRVIRSPAFLGESAILAEVDPAYSRCSLTLRQVL